MLQANTHWPRLAAKSKKGLFQWGRPLVFSIFGNTTFISFHNLYAVKCLYRKTGSKLVLGTLLETYCEGIVE